MLILLLLIIIGTVDTVIWSDNIAIIVTTDTVANFDTFATVVIVDNVACVDPITNIGTDEREKDFNGKYWYC